MTTVFREVGPYAIESLLGTGMALVYLARDTRSGQVVALKLVPCGADADSVERVEAEQRGADLQRRFSDLSPYVPKVYDSGFAGDHFYIAMEFVAGHVLSKLVHDGPMPADRATTIAIQLCEFLEQADRFEADTGSRRVLLHNDLKPGNVQVMPGDEIKVLDFGAAKALSLSRKVTQTDFGSIPYLSPECLDTGFRDRHSDAWALGVMLYEMIRGRQPFAAENTRRLEHRIRSRARPDPLDETCPRPLQAIIGKLLAPRAEDRYDGPHAIRRDLERFRAGERTQAEDDGWPNREYDEPVTRRTRIAAPDMQDEPPTRRTARPDATAAALAVEPPPVIGLPAGAAATTAIPAGASSAPVSRPRSRARTYLRLALVILVVGLLGNESCVALQARRLATSIPMQEFEGLTNVWTQYESLAERSYLGRAAVQDLEHALTRQTLILSERVMKNYLSPSPSVRENQWKAARDSLRRAIAVAPGDAEVRAALRYCEGHLHRIDGEARKARRELPAAQQELGLAVTAFRDAASLRKDWPDPYLGLARTYIYGLEDVDLAVDALAQAQKLGYVPGERETVQLGDGYRARAESLARTADDLRGLPQEREYLSRTIDAYRSALERYAQVAGLPNVASVIRQAQQRLDRAQHRLDELSKIGAAPWV
jgi:serine/threonine protein kinase